MNDKQIEDFIIKSFINLTEDYRKRSTRIDARIMHRMDINELYPHCKEAVLIETVQQRDRFIAEYSTWKNWLLSRRPRIRSQAIQNIKDYLEVFQNREPLKKKISATSQTNERSTEKSLKRIPEKSKGNDHNHEILR